MASFPSVTRWKTAPAGSRVWEYVRLSTGTGALSTTAALDFTSNLRTIAGFIWGKNSTFAQVSTTALTWTNGTFSSMGSTRALVTFSGMSTSPAEKIFSLVLIGRR